MAHEAFEQSPAAIISEEYKIHFCRITLMITLSHPVAGKVRVNFNMSEYDVLLSFKYGAA